ncbi:RfaG Glycosyltransferase [Candidatus Pelagibacterales bacterium]
MTIGIDLVGTNLGSGTKTYNINFCNELNSLKFSSNIKIFICRNYLSQITKKKNKRIKYLIKPNFLSISFFRLLWMQLILPFELKFLGIKKLYSPMNFSPILSKFLNIKSILCLHSNLPWVYFNLMPGNLLRNFITKKLMEMSIYSCDLLIVNSNFAKKEIVKALRLYKKNIKVIYLGVSKIFTLKKYEKKIIKNFNYNQKYILSVISCVRYHNIINLLKAFKLLIKNYDIKLVLVLQILDKNYFLDIIKFIANNSLEQKIIIFSNLSIDQLPRLYKNAQIYVFTSYCEVFGFTSLEAMSKKIPVVISNKSALFEINRNAAIYFNPDDIIQIKNSLKKVMLSKKLSKQLVQKGNLQFKKFNSEENIKKTIDLIQNF